MSSIFDDGVVVNRKIREYQSAHPGTSYDAAYRALIRLEEAQEKEFQKEFDSRVKAYSAEFPNADAAQLVAKHDDDMIHAYAENDPDQALAKRIGQIWREAKQDTAGGAMKMSEAVLRRLQSEREASQKIAGDWLSSMALREINNANMGSSVKEVFPRAFAAVRSVYPEVDQMYQTGAVSRLAMRVIFSQWFRD